MIHNRVKWLKRLFSCYHCIFINILAENPKEGEKVLFHLFIRTLLTIIQFFSGQYDEIPVIAGYTGIRPVFVPVPFFQNPYAVSVLRVQVRLIIVG